MIAAPGEFIHGNRKRCQDNCAIIHKRENSRERQRFINECARQTLINREVLRSISNFHAHKFPINADVQTLIDQGFRFDNGLITLTSDSKDNFSVYRVDNFQIEYNNLNNTITIYNSPINNQ